MRRALLALSLAVVACASSVVSTTTARAPSPLATIGPSAWITVTTTPSWPSLTPSSPDPTSGPSPKPSTKPTSKPRTSVYTRSWYGEASWGYFGGHVVTRLPRGTRIEIVGPLGRWRGVSWGYGPAKWTGRIADLDKEVFRSVCGSPSRGVCNATLKAE